MRPLLKILALLMLAAVLAACGGQAAQPPPTAAPTTPPTAPVPPASPAPAAAFPVTIEQCGETLTFTEPPQRVIATWQSMAEVLLALGLEEATGGFWRQRLLCHRVRAAQASVSSPAAAS